MREKDLVLIQAVIDTLSDEQNGISVRGYDNMKKVIGCVNALQDVVRENMEEGKDGG